MYMAARLFLPILDLLQPNGQIGFLLHDLRLPKRQLTQDFVLLHSFALVSASC